MCRNVDIFIQDQEILDSFKNENGILESFVVDGELFERVKVNTYERTVSQLK